MNEISPQIEAFLISLTRKINKILETENQSDVVTKMELIGVVDAMRQVYEVLYEFKCSGVEVQVLRTRIRNRIIMDNPCKIEQDALMPCYVFTGYGVVF